MNTFSNQEAKQIREETALLKDKKLNRKSMIRSRLEDYKTARDLDITLDDLNQNRWAYLGEEYRGDNK